MWRATDILLNTCKPFVPQGVLDADVQALFLAGYLRQTGRLTATAEEYLAAAKSFTAATGLDPSAVLGLLASLAESGLRSERGCQELTAYVLAELADFCRELGLDPPAVDVYVPVPAELAVRVSDLCKMRKPFMHARVGEHLHSVVAAGLAEGVTHTFKFDLVNAEGGPVLLAYCVSRDGLILQASPPLYPAFDGPGPHVVFEFAAVSPVCRVAWVFDRQ